jgi:tricarboxylate carrier
MSGEAMRTRNQTGDDQLVPFTFSKPFYDLNTYVGRFKNVWASTNPVLFWVTKNQIKESQDTLKRYKEEEIAAKKRNEPFMITKAEFDTLRKADSVVRSAVHPDTGEIIPNYMRFTAYLYANIPINFGMLLTQPTAFNIALWQWVNQTYYVGVNYSNRNASSKFTNKDLVIAYCAAVTASIGVGLGVKRFIEPFKNSFSGSKAFFFMFTISFVANSAANGTNLLIVRSKELKEGIPVMTEDGQEVGMSKKVGRSAVFQTAFTRCMMPILPLGIPTVAFYLLDRMKLIPKSKPLNLVQQLVVFSASIMFAPAMALACFPQISKKSVTSLEPEFQNLKDNNGNPITELYYNKGL